MPLIQPCAFHIIFLILWFWLAVDNLPMIRTWLRSRSCPYTIINVYLSLPDQMWFKIKLFPIWVHLDFRPNFVIVENLYCPSISQYTTNNHAYIHIEVFRKFLLSHCSAHKLPQAWFYWYTQGEMMIYDIIPSTKLVNMTICLSNLTMSWFLDDYSG